MKLGTRVTAKNQLVRRYNNADRNNILVSWGPPKYRNKTIKGIYIGWRTYANGNIHYNYEDGKTFLANEHIKVALIVESLRTRPIPVLYSEMEEAE